MEVRKNDDIDEACSPNSIKKNQAPGTAIGSPRFKVID